MKTTKCGQTRISLFVLIGVMVAYYVIFANSSKQSNIGWEPMLKDKVSKLLRKIIKPTPSKLNSNRKKPPL